MPSSKAFQAINSISRPACFSANLLQPHRRGLRALASKPSAFLLRSSLPRRTTRTLDGPIGLALTRRSYNGWGPPPSILATQRAVWVLLGLNASVFGLWCYANATQDRPLYNKLRDNTLLSWENLRANRPWTVLTSAFTHKEPVHFVCNMIGLNAFGSAMIFAGGVGIGSANIFALAVGSALAGSAAWLYEQRAPEPRKNDRWWVQEYRAANGASGMVTGFAMASTLIAPFARGGLIFLPFISVPMWVLTAAYIAYDAYFLGKNDRIGHSAHLGGAVFGVAYYVLALRRFGGVSQLLRRNRF